MRMRLHLSDPFFRNAYALIANTGLTGALGLAFWALAARTYTDPDVGRGSALISAMTLLSGIVAINLAGTLGRFIPESGERTARLVLMAYGLSSLAVLGLTAGFLVLLGWWGAPFELLRDPTTATFFVGAVVAAGIFTVQDGVLVGLRSATWVPVENTAFGIAKIVLLVVLAAQFPRDGIYLAWVVPMVLLLLPVNALIFGRLVPRHAAASPPGRSPPTRRAIGRFFLADYTGALCMFGSVTLPPILVAPFVEAHTFAYFYLGWIAGGVLSLIGPNLAASLTVEGVHDAPRLVANCRAALRRGLGLTTVAAVLIGLLAAYGLALLGPGYVDAAPLLQALAIAAVFRTVIEIWVGVLRARSRVREIARVQIATGGLAIGAVLLWLYVRTWVPAIELITGVGLAILASQIVVVLAIAPAITRFLRRPRPCPEQPSHTVLAPRVATPTGPAVAAAVGRPPWRRLVPAVVIATSLVGAGVVAAGLARVQPAEVDGYGLVSALPATVFVGLGIVTITYLATLALRRPHRLALGVQLVVVVCCIHGATIVTSSLARFPVTWIHLGFVEFISRTGGVDPMLDARFSWPGFFALAAFWLGERPWHELAPVLSAVPVVSNLLYLLPMALLLRNLRMSWQARWLAAWLFCVLNWIGQDYFSPQGYSYWLYLMFVAGAVAWLRAEPTARHARTGRWEPVLRLLRPTVEAVPGELPPNPLEPRLRCAALFLLIGLFVVATFSHQLTPFFMLAACTGLVLTDRCACRGLPILLAAILAAFISYLAVGYWGGHLGELLAGIGDIAGNLTTSIVERMGTGSQHQHVVAVRIGSALAAGALAAIGTLRRRRRRVDDRIVLVLLVMPLVALGLQSYGGEIGLRVFLFALPALAVLSAYAFFPETESQAARPGRYMLVGVSMLALVAAFLVARYGNEAYERTDPAALAAVEYVYRQEGAVRVVALTDAPASDAPPFLPVGYRDVERTSYLTIVAPPDPTDLTDVIATLRELGPGAYLVTAIQTENYLTFSAGYPADWGERFARRLAAEPQLRQVAAGGGAAVYVLRGLESAGPDTRPAPEVTGISVGSTPGTPIGVVFLCALVGVVVWREVQRLRGTALHGRAIPLLVALLFVALSLVILERLVLLT